MAKEGGNDGLPRVVKTSPIIRDSPQRDVPAQIESKARVVTKMKISVVYHSETGNTARMAQLVAAGCRRVSGVEVKCMSTEEADPNFLQNSAAVIFGSPTHDGTLSWQLKKFIREVGRETFAGKLGAVFVSQNWPGGGGGSFAEMSIIAVLLFKGMLV